MKENPFRVVLQVDLGDIEPPTAATSCRRRRWPGRRYRSVLYGSGGGTAATGGGKEARGTAAEVESLPDVDEEGEHDGRRPRWRSSRRADASSAWSARVQRTCAGWNLRRLGRLCSPTGSESRRWRQQLHRGADEFREIACAEFLLQLGADIDDGLVAYVEFAGDALIGLAIGEQRQHL
jgi:hypothetical protein